MCSLFKKYSITPIFVFDGKPPVEKQKELEFRKKERYIAKQKYEDLLISTEKIFHKNKK